MTIFFLQELKKPNQYLEAKVREEMARSELFYQSQLLEKDKALHQKEKEIQLVDQEVQQLKQVKFSFSEKATKICAIFLMVWAWMFTK